MIIKMEANNREHSDSNNRPQILGRPQCPSQRRDEELKRSRGWCSDIPKSRKRQTTRSYNFAPLSPPELEESLPPLVAPGLPWVPADCPGMGLGRIRSGSFNGTVGWLVNFGSFSPLRTLPTSSRFKTSYSISALAMMSSSFLFSVSTFVARSRPSSTRRRTSTSILLLVSGEMRS